MLIEEAFDYAVEAMILVMISGVAKEKLHFSKNENQNGLTLTVLTVAFSPIL